MDESTIRKSLCYRCVYKEYTSKYWPNGAYYKDWQCFYPQHRHVFGRVVELSQCQDYEDESAVEARLTGGL